MKKRFQSIPQTLGNKTALYTKVHFLSEYNQLKCNAIMVINISSDMILILKNDIEICCRR